MSVSSSLARLVENAAECFGSCTALVGLNGVSNTYAELAAGAQAIGREIRAKGISRHDRVAVVMPDGVDAATALVGLSSFCACAPFNPRHTTSEFENFFRDHPPKAVIVAGEAGAGARVAARTMGVPVWDWASATGSNGGSRLAGSSPYSPSTEGPGQSSDLALTLYTSGTTSRPKLVPLTQGNLLASAQGIARWLRLEPDDRCLNVMPLFHIHGLVAGLLSSVAAGASVVCTPGFSAGDFFRWVGVFSPTWYTAVPTMHQAILAAHAGLNPQARATRLRFVRSSSAPLAPDLMTALESAFHAPVIEAYGMTEASHQVASNPLPPAPRKAGSVGLPAGSDVVILDETRQPLPCGSIGEVAIRGAGVTAGYAANAPANADAFADGWFRTGDQGYLDEDGYLVLTGRIKELINRGGEKIAPREIDEALLAHPAVAQAVAFGMPDVSYGEQVAAAVVLRAGSSADTYELQRHVAGRLAHFKVPRHIVIVNELPKGPTGKVQRRNLPEALGLAGRAPVRSEDPGADPDLQQQIAGLWCEVLDRADVPTDVEFIAVGGDSLAAARLANRLRMQLGVDLSLADVLAAPTVREQAAICQRARAGRLP